MFFIVLKVNNVRLLNPLDRSLLQQGRGAPPPLPVVRPHNPGQANVGRVPEIPENVNNFPGQRLVQGNVPLPGGMGMIGGGVQRHSGAAPVIGSHEIPPLPGPRKVSASSIAHGSPGGRASTGEGSLERRRHERFVNKYFFSELLIGIPIFFFLFALPHILSFKCKCF